MSIRKKIDTLLRHFEREFETHNLIEVSSSAIRHNVSLMSDLVGKPAIPVLKGNAYGHGIQNVARGLKGTEIPYVAVDGYFEALLVREVSDLPVLVMGAILPDNFTKMKYDNFAFVVQDKASIHALGQTGKKVKVHLECNTGMNRYGVSLDEAPKLAQIIKKYKNLTLEGVMSHLADSDGEDQATVDDAVEKFDKAIEAVLSVNDQPSMFHIAQTAGSIKARSQYANAFRLGIGLYGINPFPKQHPLHQKLVELQPALKLTSTITKIIELNKGDHVSYNYTFTAPKKMRIGVFPLGYYEGLSRGLSNSGVVKVGDKYAKITGRVCMNHTMINLDGIDVKIGDKVVVYSNNPLDENSIDNLAHEHGLFNYHILTSLSHDVRRRLVS